MHQEKLKTHKFLEIIPPGHHDAVTSSRLRLNIFLIVFFGKCLQIYPLRFSGPKNYIFPKPEVSLKKVKIEVFALDGQHGSGGVPASVVRRS